jgi:hypothetical protein
LKPKRNHENVPDNSSSAARSRKRLKSESTGKEIDDTGSIRSSTRHAASKKEEEENSDHESKQEDTPSEPTRRTRSTPARKGKAPATSFKKRKEEEEESGSDSRLPSRQTRTTRAVASKKVRTWKKRVLSVAEEESVRRATRSKRKRGKVPTTASKKRKVESDSESAIGSKGPTRQTGDSRIEEEEEVSIGGGRREQWWCRRTYESCNAIDERESTRHIIQKG